MRFPGFEGEWEIKKLSEVAEIGRGKSKHRPRDAEFLFGGTYPFIQTGDIRKANLYLTEFSQTYSEAGLRQSKLWNENTLCITIAANIAETAILKIRACFPDSIIGLIPKEDQTIVLFVKHLFDKFKIQIQSLSQGAAQDNLNQEKLSKIEFSFPSIVEQVKISSFLSCIDDQIQTQNKIIEELKLLKNSLSKKIFTQQIRFPNFNEKWKTVRLGEVGTFFSGGTPLTTKKDYFTGNIPFIRSGEINADYTEQFISEKGLKNSSAKLIEVGDLIYALYGATSGEVGISKIKGAINQAILCIRTILNNVFLLNYLRLQKESILKTYLQGGQGNLSAEIIKSLKIPLPTHAEQTKIANFLSAIDQRIELETGISKVLTKQKQYLLRQMFI